MKLSSTDDFHAILMGRNIGTRITKNLDDDANKLDKGAMKGLCFVPMPQKKP